MRNKTLVAFASAGSLLFAGGVAAAQDRVEEEAEDVREAAGELARETGELAEAVVETTPLIDTNLAVFGGVGIEGWSSDLMRDQTSAAGQWEVRALMGTQSWLGFEAAYVGSAADIDAQLGAESGTLIGTTLEGTVRGNLIPRGPWQPYAFAGLGWRNYSVAGADFSRAASGMRDSTNLLVVPVGAGVTYRFTPAGISGLQADARFTFRPALGDGLVLVDPLDPGRDSFADMHTWAISARVGWEF